MSKQSVLQELANRAAVELARVAAVRPALSSRCERAVGILADHAVSPRRGLIRAQFRGAKLTAYLVRGSGGTVYRIETKGSWRCSCPDHHGRHRRRGSSRACKHALAVWALWRAAVGARSPAVVAVEVQIRRGGLRTLALYDRPYFSLLARLRWGRVEVEALVEYREAVR